MSRYANYIFSVLIMAIVAFDGSAYTNDTAAQNEMKKLIERIGPAFVFFPQGSGVVISDDGLVLTNSHVLIGDETEFSIRLGNGKAQTAQLLGRDPFGDLALLRVKGASGLKHINLAPANSIAPGQLCIAVGNPFAVGLMDQRPTITLGVVSGLHQLRGRYTDAVVTDVPINPGNSGGPLIDLNGDLIGINGMIKPSLGLRSNTGLAYAIPSNQIKVWIPRLAKSNGKQVYHGAVRGMLFESDEETTDPGARISQLLPDSSAQKLGFKNGDIVKQVNGYPMWSPQRFYGIIGTYPADHPIKVVIRRGKEKRRVELNFKLPELRPGRLYIKLATPKPRDKHLVIGKVETGSPAEKAGLKAGDILRGIMGGELSGSATLQYLLFQSWSVTLPQNSRILLVIERVKGGKKEMMRITYVAD